MQVILVAKGRDDLPACSGAPLMLCNHTFDKVAIGMFKHFNDRRSNVLL